MASTSGKSIITVDTTELKNHFVEYSDKITQVIQRSIQVAGLDAEKWTKEFEMKRPRKEPWEWSYSKGQGFTIRKSSRNRLLQSLSRGGVGNIWEEKKFEITYGSNVKYAPAIIGDTDPFDIRPRKAKALIFAVGPNPKTDIIFAKKVTHPGGKKLTGDGNNYGLLTRVGKVIESNAQTYLINAAKQEGIEVE
jgi:hypothetical protein